ncbi:hypothetical protein VAE115_320200 [Vibrio aestuarianus]|nr:hypothetical protein VAE032_270199 [Vibrio aestuarianus]CAH8193973.1 hypothetical protein VAE115_320200 [Vibrio aestuarianus]CAH8203794.1 hypothetical protein VAE016_370199 [Vibrio aestuarianus]CAH8207504.1 hypothetical protein VAE122_2960190 [Vibrio aestuarianus]
MSATALVFPDRHYTVASGYMQCRITGLENRSKRPHSSLGAELRELILERRGERNIGTTRLRMKLIRLHRH